MGRLVFSDFFFGGLFFDGLVVDHLFFDSFFLFSYEFFFGLRFRFVFELCGFASVEGERLGCILFLRRVAEERSAVVAANDCANALELCSDAGGVGMCCLTLQLFWRNILEGGTGRCVLGSFFFDVI
ncbi:hypothetical protein [Cognatiyoonia sp.]|uniref:hypothetical protein n=1 Tax=Cognatiyoonia sp. TaxID=2211652 RepID=UPI003F698184